MDETWNQIVAEALAAGLKTSSGPVPGAKLRELIVKAAHSRNLQYPPSGHEQESFGDFLKHFDSIVLVRRRKGRDLLTAPADMPQLLAEEPEGGAARVREDIFEAFTRIPRGVPPSEPWYVVSDDTVVWLLLTELSGSGELVKIPAATLEQELSERKSFIESADLAQERIESLQAWMPIPGSGLFQSSSRPTAFHKCGTATDFKRSSAELERGAPQPAFLGARNGFRRATHRSRQLKLEMIDQLRISAIYSSDSSNRSQMRTYVGSRSRSISCSR